MPAFNAEEFTESLENMQSTEAVDKAFAEIFAMPEGQRRVVAEAVERACSAAGAADETMQEVVENGPEGAKQTLRKEFARATMRAAAAATAAFVTDGQVTVQIVKKIADLRGDEASPFVKVYNAAAKALTITEYNSPECVFKPMDAVIDAAAVKLGIYKPNPHNPGVPQL